jgi:hypothetical protein
MLDPENYTISLALFLRLLGFIYFVVYLPFLFQIKGLLGSKGILPTGRYLQGAKRILGKKAYHFLPTIFWLNHSDKVLIGSICSALLFSVLLMLNIFPPLMLLLLYCVHLSIVSIGQDFLSFGWEMFLLEITFNAFFLSLTEKPNLMMFLSLNLLLFRFHFQAGAVKLQSRDINWRNFTGLAFHYLSQPLPNATAWFVHKLPLWFHKISTALMFFVELVVPFALFGSEDLRFFVWIFFVGLQALIWATGNFSYLNHLTAVFSTILLSNHYLEPLFGKALELGAPSIYVDMILSSIGSTLILLQLMNLWSNLFKPLDFFRQIQHFLSPYHIINRYGIFAVMTTKRYEIVVEGSQDGIEWKEYLFRYKPSEINRRPRRISPFQPRLDWQAWFLPFSDFEDNIWFQQFLGKLLLGENEVLALIRYNPFPDKPPLYIRAVVYDYKFTDFKTLRQTGNWWKRTYIGAYSPIIQIDMHYH